LRTLSALILVVLLAAEIICGQIQSRNAQEEYQLLKHPQCITFELARRLAELNEDPKDLSKPFKMGDNIFFRLIMTNNSSEPITLRFTNPYYQNRPELLRDGQKVQYRKRVAEIVEAVDKEVEFSKVSQVDVKPSEPTYVDILNLNDWYDALPPGKYQLTDRFRFVVGGDWLECPSVSFSVEPK
jgi:hypothetical protein